jgi:hypothetical protein
MPDLYYFLVLDMISISNHDLCMNSLSLFDFWRTFPISMLFNSEFVGASILNLENNGKML